jgi:hypothetical protein
MNWNAMLGIACIVSFLLPITVIVYNRFYTHRSLAALLIYFLSKAVYTLLSQEFISVSDSLLCTVRAVNHYMDVPLMLTALLFFCPNKPRQRLILWLMAFFFSYEFLVTFIYGFKKETLKFIIGPGRIMILAYAFYLFIRQVKFSILHRKNQGRILMLASILFAYGCNCLIYYFYYILDTPYKKDVELLYYISSIIASFVMSIGLHLMRKRIKELHTLKVTRKELAMFFSHS